MSLESGLQSHIYLRNDLVLRYATENTLLSKLNSDALSYQLGCSLISVRINLGIRMNCEYHDLKERNLEHIFLIPNIKIDV
jgi:hypothetical protein